MTTSLSAPVCAGRAGDHEVVDDSAIFVEKLGIALAAWSEVEKIRGAERFKKARDGRVAGALDQRLTHVRNVEQPSRLAGVEVLGEDPGRILDRHVVARERRHARAELDMQRVKRRCLVEASVMGPPVVQKRPQQRQPPDCGLALADAPSVP